VRANVLLTIFHEPAKRDSVALQLHSKLMVAL